MASNRQNDWDEPESQNPAFSPLSILRTIGKRKVRILIAWVLFALIGSTIVYLLPSVYLAEAVILVDTQKIPEKFVSATVASDLEDRIAAIRQTLLSGDQLKRIIDEFGLYKDQRKTHFDEEIFDMMRKDITITLEPITSGNAQNKHTADFRIGYQGSDPNLVMRVANRVADLYVEQNLKTRKGEAQGTSEFLDTQLADAKQQLDKLEAAVSAYKLQHNGELPQQEQTLVSALSGSRRSSKPTATPLIGPSRRESSWKRTSIPCRRTWNSRRAPCGNRCSRTTPVNPLPYRFEAAEDKRRSLEEQLEVSPGHATVKAIPTSSA